MTCHFATETIAAKSSLRSNEVPTSMTGRLCSAVAGHMLALHRSEALRQSAARWGGAGALSEAEDAVAAHRGEVVAIVERFKADGLPIWAISGALASFAPTAVAALASALPELRPTPTPTLIASASTNAVWENITPRLTGPLANGGTLEERVFARIVRAGRRGASRRALLKSVNGEADASALTGAVTKLEVEGAITSIVVQPKNGGRPATHYLMGRGPFTVDTDGAVVLAPIRPRGSEGACKVS